MRARIIVIANQKGGVGKTTTAHALTTGLIARGYKTLAIDMDPQSNLTYTMGADQYAPGVYDLMKDTIGPEGAIQHTEQGDIIGGSLMLSGADMEFTDTGREYILSEHLEPLTAVYDYIVVDTAPTLGILAINALTVAHDLIIPLGADAYSLQGLSQLHATITKVRKHCNPSLTIAGLLITRYNERTVVSRELKDVIEEKAAIIGARAFRTVIRERVAIKEAQVRQTSIFASIQRGPGGDAVFDYLEFIDEYLKGAADYGKKVI
jgi:chromosome partitioning protein